jgi:DNA processing protein
MNRACRDCARRGWLLAELSRPLDFRSRDLAQFWSALELSEGELIDALGGKRRAELHEAYAEWRPQPAASTPSGEQLEQVCLHHRSYPRTLRDDALAPRMLYVRGGVQRIESVLEGIAVAIVGTRRATDYGIETARNLARDLSSAGLTVLSSVAEGIPLAVHKGVLEGSGETLAIVAGGLERCSPAWCEALVERIVAHGCAISETPRNLRAHRWCEVGCSRTLALLADLVVVVEAEDRPWELACAHVAQLRGKLVAAVPGRLHSQASKGTNSLLMHGARLIRGPQDALDLLYGVGAKHVPETVIELEQPLQVVLEQVGAGMDTLAKLTDGGGNPSELVAALTELELKGLLLRGDGGRYTPSAGVSAE